MVPPHKKPQSVSSLVGNPSAFQFAKEWAKEWQGGLKPKPLLVCGPPGTGKTALARATAAEFSWEIFEFNASDLRDEENVNNLLANANSSGSLFGNRRLILIDDADSLSGREDRGGAGAIAKILSSPQQPIIITAASYYDKKLQTIRTYCTQLELRRVQAGTITNLLKKLSASGGSSLSNEQIEKIAQASGGDVRAAINDFIGGNTHATRDSEKNIFEVVRTILKSEKYSEPRKAGFAADVEHDTLKLWVAHNLPLEYERPFDLAEAYNSISRADIFDGRISRRQYWGYLRYSGDLISSGVAVAKTAPYKKFTMISYPDYIREMGASKSARSLRKAVLKKIAAGCHCSISQAISYLSWLELASAQSPSEVAGYFKFEEEEMDFIASKPKPRKAAVKKPAKK